MTRGHQLDFPDSVVEMMRGELGTPPGGFPKDVQQVILKGEEPLNVRPGKLIKPYDFESARQELFEKFERPVTDFELLAHALYPKVYEDYIKHTTTYGDVSVLDTLTFFYGLNVGETIQVEIETGKTLIIKLVQVSAANEDGIRLVSYEMNGVPREIEIKDVNVKSATTSRPKVDRSNAKQVGASMPGSVLKVLVEPGSRVHRGEQLLVTEAMKMETTIQAAQDGEIKAIHIKEGDTIQSDDLLIEFV